VSLVLQERYTKLTEMVKETVQKAGRPFELEDQHKFLEELVDPKARPIGYGEEMGQREHPWAEERQQACADGGPVLQPEEIHGLQAQKDESDSHGARRGSEKRPKGPTKRHFGSSQATKRT
jgi:hypothetical protein